MGFVGSLLALIALIWIVDLAALPLVGLLPWRERPIAQTFLGPLLGGTLLVFLVTAVGWLGHGYRAWFCVPLTLALPAAGVWVSRRRPSLCRAMRLAVFTALASFPVFCPLLRYGTFDPFNDTFIYLVHGQWLQQHGFLESARASGHHPVWTHVIGFQRYGMRMGASFLLGWLQAIFGLRWSYEIYPVTAAFGLVCGALAVGAIVAAACPGRRVEAWLAALAAAVTLDGFAFGAVFGFLHQVVGVAFAVGVLALRGLELTKRSPHSREFRSVRARFGKALPMALCSAVVVFCYPEVAPFLAAALGCSYVFPWPRGSSEWQRRWNAVWPLGLLTLVLVNAEWWRAWRSVRMQAAVVSGNPVAWQWWEFAAHALGLKAGVYDAGGWPTAIGKWWVLGGGVAAGLFTLVFVCEHNRRHHFSWRTRPGIPRSRTLIPALFLIGFMAVAFCYFRWVVPNPWPTGLGVWPPGTGQSWSQLKLGNWVSPACIACAFATGTMATTRWTGFGRFVLIAGMTLWCGVGLGWNFQRAKRRTASFRDTAGAGGNPFADQRKLREALASIPISERIGLETPGSAEFSRVKTRQLLTYFLYDRELVSDWSTDPGLAPEMMPEPERNTAGEPCRWKVRFRPENTKPKPESTETDPLQLERESALLPP